MWVIANYFEENWKHALSDCTWLSHASHTEDKTQHQQQEDGSLTATLVLLQCSGIQGTAKQGVPAFFSNNSRVLIVLWATEDDQPACEAAFVNS